MGLNKTNMTKLMISCGRSRQNGVIYTTAICFKQFESDYDEIRPCNGHRSDRGDDIGDDFGIPYSLFAIYL